MSGKSKQIISSVSTIVFCVFAFAIMTFLTLKQEAQPAAEPKTDVRAESIERESAGFLFKFPFGSVFLNFNFSDSNTGVLFMTPEDSDKKTEECGYTVFKQIFADYDFLANFIDRYGGLEIEENSETLRYTGVQISQKLQQNAEESFKKQVTEKLLGSIASKGFSKSDLAFLIEKTQSSLSFPEGYALLELIPKAAKDIYFIN